MDDARVEQEEGDAMAELENRTAESKNEMDILDALDEMRAQVGDMLCCAALCCQQTVLRRLRLRRLIPPYGIVA